MNIATPENLSLSHSNAHAGLLPVAPETDTITTSMEDVRPPSNARQVKSVIVVLGMHRSGTSLLANLLAALGVNLGENLLAADCNNEAGYWEQEEIYKLQDGLLQQIGRHWIGPAGSVPFPDEWWELPEAQAVKQQLLDIVRNEIDKTEGLWGFKDPRTSRLLPLWKEIFAELGLKPIYLLAIRNPAEVVQSIVKRDEIPASRAELLWLLHNLDAVRDAGDELQLVVDYDRWFTHPREQAQAVVSALGMEWPADDNELLSTVTQRIRPELRHNREPQPFSLPLIAKTFAALQSSAASGKVSAELQQLNRDVRTALSLCEPWSYVVEELTRPVVKEVEPYFSFVENLSSARFEKLGPQASSSIWDALIDGPMQKALFLHPPARLHFHVPDGRRARLTFAVNIHPHAWNKPNAGGCEFIVTIDNTLLSVVRVDPVKVASDRRWHECTLEIPENLNGGHTVVFETKAWGGSLDFRWAVWRDPRLTWSPNAPALPRTIFGE